jgi:2-dehydropantoate 2-reductase
VSFLASKGHVFADWKHAGRSTLLKMDGVGCRQTGCELQRYKWPVGLSRAELYRTAAPLDASDAAGNAEPTIHNLVVSGPGQLSAKTVHLLRQRLQPHSTVLLLSTGMGMYEEIITGVYPDAESRPNFILGFSTLDVSQLISPARSNTFSVYRSSHPGTMRLFFVPRNSDLRGDFVVSKSELAPSARHLVDTLARCPELAVSALPFADVHAMMLESLAVESAIQSVAALLDTAYSGMLYNFTITQVLRLLLTEACLVIRNLPELRGQHDLESRFDPDRLYDAAVDRLYLRPNVTSQMALDMRNGMMTEVRFLNGYIVKRGDEVGLRCFMNYLVMQLIRGKSTMVRREVEHEIPSVTQGEPE